MRMIWQVFSQATVIFERIQAKFSFWQYNHLNDKSAYILEDYSFTVQYIKNYNITQDFIFMGRMKMLKVLLVADYLGSRFSLSTPS